MTNAGRHLGRVALDLHAPTAAVAELAARHVVVEILGAQLQARGQALDDAGQAGAVRLAGGDQTERHVRLSLFAEQRSALESMTRAREPVRRTRGCPAITSPPPHGE